MSRNPESKIEDGFGDWLKESDYKALYLKLILFSGIGWPDRMIFCQGKLVIMEFKTPKGKLSPQQKHWKRLLERVGFKVYVPTSIAEAKRFFIKEMEAA